MTHEDKDPTPPHGTPRPQPCALRFCESYTVEGRYCREHSGLLNNYDTPADFVDEWLEQHADYHDPQARLAVVLISEALDALHASLWGTVNPDVALLDRAVEKAGYVFGFIRCARCEMARPYASENDPTTCDSCEDEDDTQNPFSSALDR